MSGGGLFLQTPNHPLKWYFVLLRWPSPPLESGSMDHCKPPSEAALPEKSGGPGGLGMLFDFFVGFLLIFWVSDFASGARWCPVVSIDLLAVVMMSWQGRWRSMMMSFNLSETPTEL
ncbi:hypothetical protein HanLR1_Chr07g0243871 [Helianthus annuus]|nr:hypothetical protein HanLR1_Chr07g0243871 [Helianthus annuus]